MHKRSPLPRLHHLQASLVCPNTLSPPVTSQSGQAGWVDPLKIDGWDCLVLPGLYISIPVQGPRFRGKGGRGGTGGYTHTHFGVFVSARDEEKQLSCNSMVIVSALQQSFSKHGDSTRVLFQCD